LAISDGVSNALRALLGSVTDAFVLIVRLVRRGYQRSEIADFFRIGNKEGVAAYSSGCLEGMGDDGPVI
jgi:hypothetical protein